MDEIKLKPCPFCGSLGKLYVCDASGQYYSNEGTVYIHGRATNHYLIRCKSCGIKTKAYKTRKGVYRAWNRRVNDG